MSDAINFVTRCSVPEWRLVSQTAIDQSRLVPVPVPSPVWVWVWFWLDVSVPLDVAPTLAAQSHAPQLQSVSISLMQVCLT